MKTLTRWAAANPRKSGAIIVLCQLVSILLCVYAGVLLFVEGMVIPPRVMYLGVGIVVICRLLYPLRASRLFLYHFSSLRRSILLGAILILGLVNVTTYFNGAALYVWHEMSQTRGYAVVPAAMMLKDQLPDVQQKLFRNVPDSRKPFLRQAFNNLVWKMKYQQEDDAGKKKRKKTFWAVVILVAIVIIFVVLLIVFGGKFSVNLYSILGETIVLGCASLVSALVSIPNSTSSQSSQRGARQHGKTSEPPETSPREATPATKPKNAP